jgi:hypothetical protein
VYGCIYCIGIALSPQVHRNSSSPCFSVFPTVHAPDGSRIGCGLLQPLENLLVLQALTTPLTDDKDTQASVMVLANFPKDDGAAGVQDRLCYMGYAEGLEASRVSYLEDSTSDHCTACTDKEAQGGHWYNGENLEAAGGSNEDPWLQLGYPSTAADGTAWFGACVETGEVALEALNRPFIVHGSDGSRISCGILSNTTDGSGDNDDGEEKIGDGGDDTSAGTHCMTAFSGIVLLALLLSFN